MKKRFGMKLVALLLVVTSVCFFVQDKKAYYND